ncbi:MAG: EAL domain-containing protein, partial [Pleurocapsa sp.]
GQIDGIETAVEIKHILEIPIVFLTAYADDQTLERAAQTGCYGYILKPFKDRELHATIKMALKKHQEKTSLHNSLIEITEVLAQYSAEKKNIYEDGLTNLPNQLMLRDLFVYLLSSINNLSDWDDKNKLLIDSQQPTINKKLLAFIYIKLDRFQRIVNSLSNDKSDLLIKSVAQRFAEHTNNFKYEGVTLRLQYSEFGILLTGLENRQIASDFVQSILDDLNRPFMIENEQIFLTASIGISFYPFDNLEIERLLEQAKQGMLYAQEQGGNKYKFYTSAFKVITSEVSSNLSLEADLHYALERQELELYYQPKINLKTGKIVSTEALLRWNHPQFGLILPNKIIPIAEASSLIDPIGSWILREACNQIKLWHQAGLNFLSMSINLSGHQFKQSNLFHDLTQLLFDISIDAKFIELELTEQILVENVQANIQKLNLIKKLGVKVALDDFGNGYSSLGYLHQFSFDILKIDRCFINNIDQNHKNAIITKAIIEMAHQLDLTVVAEGIETSAELNFVVENQCDEVQGNLFARPLPVREFEKLLLSNKCLAIDPSKLSIANT